MATAIVTHTAAVAVSPFDPPVRVDSCDSYRTTGSETEPGSPILQHSPVPLDSESLKILSEGSRLQLQWDRAMCNELGLPQGYQKVSVLLVKWREEIDQFKSMTNEEVEALHAIFKAFGYKAKVVDLSERCSCEHHSCNCTPQTRLDRHIQHFMDKYDTSNNLTIIYYTGHGTYVHEGNEGYLRLHATDEREEPSLNWDETEQTFIQRAKGDVLTIMDACFAGNVRARVREDEGIYEYLGACAHGLTTPAPGEKSFTTALLSSLEQLLKDRRSSFTTADLLCSIEEQRFRRKSPPVLYSRSQNSDRHILLGPHGLARSEQQPYFEKSEIPAYLTLRVELKQDSLTPGEVEGLARTVAKAIRSSSVKTRRVDWVKLSYPKATLKKWAMAARAVSAFKSRRSTLNTVPEEQVAEITVHHKPGLFATFGFMSPKVGLRTATVTLLKPWPGIMVGVFAVAVIASFYFRKSVVDQSHTGSLPSLRSVIQSYWSDVG